ncbi:MAG: rod shape-determining protein MreC [Firmicutes bacterium]|nr:rod shape-determining protein MreC [Bacillota bacterium]
MNGEVGDRKVSGFLKNKYNIALIVITLTIFVIMGMSVGDRPKATVVEDVIATVVSPVQSFFYNTGKSVENAVRFASEIKTLKEERDRLLLQVDKLQEDNRGLQELGKENKRLREMLGLKKKLDDFEFVGAQIIGKDPGNWFNTFTIDKGTADGLENKCAVIASKGLVGYIYDVRTNSAKVMSIIDNDSAVSALIERTRDIAVVKGDLVLQHEGSCKMDNIEKGADIIAGDCVVTSGLGGIYPKGLLIGMIKQISEEPHEISQYAIVEPAVDFKRLEEVFVIKKTNPVVEEED